MSNLSELLPAGAGAKEFSAVASGTLSNGQTVVLNSDGTVSAAVSQFSGGVVFESAKSTLPASAYDTNQDKIVVVYKDNGTNYGTAVVGTVSGDSISFGTPVVFESANLASLSVVFDSSNNKIVVTYADAGNGYYLTSIVGTVSGTSISFGTAVVAASEFIQFGNSTFDSNSNKVVLTWTQLLASSNGRAVVGTVSGTSISFGSAVDTDSGVNALFRAIIFDSVNNKIVIIYRDGSDSNKGAAVVGTVSGTSISFGSPTAYSSSSVGVTSMAFDANAGKVVIVYQDSSNSNTGLGIVGTVSGSSISFGGAKAINTIASNFITTGATFDSTRNKTIFVYRTANGRELVEGTVSGTSVSFTTPNNFDTANDGNLTLSYDPDQEKTVVAYRDVNNSDYGTGRLYDATKAGTADFIGITAQAISDTATGVVTPKGGVNNSVTGLTIGADYYVQDDGSLASGSIPYSITAATYLSNFDPTAQVTNPTGLAFNTDGTKMFIVDNTGQDVNEYTLATAWDVTGATYVQNYSVSSQEVQPNSIAFNSNGTKMFILGQNGDDVNEYTLSTGFDIGSTITFIDSFSVAAKEGQPSGLAFNVDGTKMYVIGRDSDAVHEYSLSAFDVSTASFTQSYSVASEDIQPRAVAFSSGGTKMFITGDNNDAVYEYALSTGFDISTSSYTGNSLNLSAQEVTPYAIQFSSDGTKMFISGITSDRVGQYSTAVAASTTVPAGRALSTTSILLEG
jgi:hypothetical protein